MAKSLVIRWVVPPIVITPAAATTTQNRATSALWRSTKRVIAGIMTSESGGRRPFRQLQVNSAVPGPRRASRDGWHLALPPRDYPRPAYSPGSSQATYRGRATPRPGMPTLTCMESVAAAWRRWLSSPVRDVIIALVVTAALL